MVALWRTVRSLLTVLPAGTRRFISTFAVLQSMLAILDVLALGLLAMIMAPMLTGASFQVPVIGVTISEPAQFRNILILVGLLIIGKSVLAICLQWWATRRFARFEQVLGAQLLETTFRAPWTERLTRNSTEIVRATDVGVGATVAGVLIPFCQLSGELFTFIAVLGVLLVAQPVLASATIVYFGLIGAVLYLWVLRKAVKAGQDNRNYSTRAVRLISEMIHSLKEITLRNKSGEVAEVVLSVRKRASQARANQSFLGAIPRYVLEAGLIGGLGIGATIGYLQAVASGEDGVSGALAAVALFGVAGFRIVPSLTRFQTIMAQTGANMPFADQVLAEIERGRGYVAADAAAGARDLPDAARTLRLDRVTFSYPGSEVPAVREVSLELPFGQTLALVGASGSGKSTLVDIILGLLEPSEGRVLVGETPLEEVLLGWRSKVGYVPQEVSLFDASVARNVALTWKDSEVDEDRVRRALERAQMLDVIEARPGGIHGKVGERGMSLSGGQKQRLGVARALYTDPVVLVMDEATSALDTSTEAAVTSAIRELAGEVSVIVVAHRLATIRHSEQVCFMRDGRLIAQGTFEEVVAAEPDFATQAALAGLTPGQERVAVDAPAGEEGRD
ncbi:ABC transporter ATP-binding protein [Ornithinicoccus hortensis]|uniref:ABC-type bacteriocin/lantibiotic exporter with double-glycine peptidase domain n=1 Tax=Ornithinicoccus hortensis TaxID=82346 RepID=A0A542YTL0_9MICO|nr:ABC transporter ATP-binding protein [Ornithinicoccus hortensis]TQL51426.1 ABC-type bacteriocin/lantibiotic exporter with double-glycine peptidase domain [Ornithinicoccus hortensis]